ncbi:MAG: glycosyl hydrolase [Pseudomonadota bacterium]
MSSRALSVLFAALCICPGPARADPETLYQMLTWRNVGPEVGGRSIAVGASSLRPDEYYFGATGGGLWKSNDGGGEWTPVTDGQIGSASVGAIAVDPTDPDVIYIGMGEGQLRSNVLQGDGLYKSQDGGKTWRHMGLAATRTITTIRIHPKNPQMIYVAALGDPFADSPQRGVYRSEDGGSSWQQILFRSAKAGAIDLTMDPNNPSVLFASTWQVHRKPWQLWSGGPDSGLFKSVDGGDSWKEITRNRGLPETVLGKITVAVSPADSNRVYANIQAEAGGLYRSDDGGETWAYINGDRKLWQRAFYFLQVRPDPVDRDTVYVLSFQLEKSTDAGHTFQSIQTRHVDIHDLWIDPQNNQRMVVADDGGGSVTVNGGKTWTLQDYPTGQMYRVTTTDDFPYHVCGSQQDNMTFCVPSRSASGLPGFREPFAPAYNIDGSEMGYVAVNPEDSDIFFVGATNGLSRFNRRTGARQDVHPYPYVVMGQAAMTMPERWNWTFPIVFSPVKPHALYAGSQHLWRSMDLGQSWRRISPDLTRAEPATLGPTGGPIRLDQDGPEVHATLYTIAPSPIRKNTIWAGSDDGLVHVTTKGGNDFGNVTPQALPQPAKISFIDASPHAPCEAYVVAKRYELGDRTPYAWRTDDCGQHWTNIAKTLPAEHFLHALRVDPQQPGLLYAGSEHGVYVSFNNGNRWHSLRRNMPDTVITGLVVKSNELVVATHGRAFYILEGLDTLRQIARDSDAEKTRLFTPAEAMRRILPANIHFYLAQDAQSVSLDIIDGDNNLVRRLITEQPMTAGAHNHSWLIRHQGATVVPGMILESLNPAIGPLAIPGEYQVRLAVDGTTYSSGLDVVPDPRSAATRKDLKAQLSFAIAARDAVDQAHRTLLAIDALRGQITTGLEYWPGAPIESAQAILGQLQKVETSLYQTKNQSPKDKIAFPIQLNDRLAGLAGYVAFSDAAPTRAQKSMLHQLRAELDRHLQAYAEVLNRDLPELNRLLTSNGQSPINLPEAR